MNFAASNKWEDVYMGAQSLCATHVGTRACRGRGSGG